MKGGMSLIEGIGDEVTVLAACLIVLAIVVIAWISTRVDVRTNTSVVIIDRERFSELLRRVRGVAIHSDSAGSASETDTARTSDAATETSVPSDSVLVAGASAGAHAKDRSCSSHGDGDNDDLNCDETSRCSGDADPSVSRDSAESSLQCETSSPVQSGKDCINSTSSLRSSETVDSLTSDNNLADSGDVPSGTVQVRLQFVDGRQKTVYAKPDDTIGYFKRSHFASELASNLVVRFIAGGQELKDETSTLRSHQISFSGAVLHCLVTPARPTAPPPDDRQNMLPPFDIGILMFPLFGTVLAALWYARIVYRGYFNGTSTFSLLAISFLYIVAVLATLRGGGQAEHHAHVE